MKREKVCYINIARRISVYLQLVHQVSLATVEVPLAIILLPESAPPTNSTNPSGNSSPPPSPSLPSQLPSPPQCLIHYTSGLITNMVSFTRLLTLFKQTGKLVVLHLAENREEELAADVEQPWLGRALTDYDYATPHLISIIYNHVNNF